MSDYTIIERIIHRINKEVEPYFAPLRRKKLNNTDFTIISNNCWGGLCYEYFGLPKQSPTVGCYFFAEEYIRFITALPYYLNCNLTFIPTNKSRYYKELAQRKQEDVLVGVLDDVEIVFLHYNDPIVAKAKWDRRVSRVNWNNLIIKFSYMNKCNDSLVDMFVQAVDNMHNQISDAKSIKSVLFVPKAFSQYPYAIVLPNVKNGQIINDTFYWNKYCDIYSLINN